MPEDEAELLRALHDALLRAWKPPRSLSRATAARSWLYTVARNIVY
nr:sigma factor [Rathayibacter toxicus]